MKHAVLRKLALGALIVGGIAATSQGAFADGGKAYRITIANATGGQPLAPGLVIVHDRDYALFQVNDAPTLELATMAETGDPGLLADAADAAPGVASADVLAGDGGHPPLALPGEANSITVTAAKGAKYLTAVGMLAATNDAFYAVRGIRLPKKGQITVNAVAYDAGSEANNEAAGDVPALGNGDDAGVNAGDGEGFIHVHGGIHGGAGLDPATHDWRNPVVEITIERLDDDD